MIPVVLEAVRFILMIHYITTLTHLLNYHRMRKLNMLFLAMLDHFKVTNYFAHNYENLLRLVLGHTSKNGEQATI